MSKLFAQTVKAETLIKEMQGLSDQLNTYLKKPVPDRPRVSSTQESAAIFIPLLTHLEREELWVMSLNTRNGVISVKQVYRGTVDTSPAKPHEIIKLALVEGATRIIIAHNHPSGDPAPSPEDIVFTRTLNQACELMQLSLLDSLVIGGNQYVSIKERGFI